MCQSLINVCLSKSSLLFDTLYHHSIFLQCLHGYFIQRERPPKIFQHFSVHKYYCHVTGHSTGSHCLKCFTVMSAVFSDNIQWMFPRLGLMLFSMSAGRIFIEPTLEHYNYHGKKCSPFCIVSLDIKIITNETPKLRTYCVQYTSLMTEPLFYKIWRLL